MVNRLPLVIGIVMLAVFVWGYAVTVDRAFFDAALDGADRLFRPGPMIALVLMIPIAIISGLMPGGGLPFLVVVLAFATELDPFIALPVVIGYMGRERPHRADTLHPARHTGRALIPGDDTRRLPACAAGLRGIRTRGRLTPRLSSAASSAALPCSPCCPSRGVAAVLRLRRVLPPRAARHRRGSHRQRRRRRQRAPHCLPWPVHWDDRVREHRKRDPRDLRHRLPLRRYPHRARRGGDFSPSRR